jgi:hypothetical protein
MNYRGTGGNWFSDSQDENRASPTAFSVIVTGHSIYRGGLDSIFPVPGRLVGRSEAMIFRLPVNRALAVRWPQEMREFTPVGVVSLFPEGDNWVDAGSAESGNVAGRKGNAEEEGGDGPESSEVGGLNAVEHGA